MINKIIKEELDKTVLDLKDKQNIEHFILQKIYDFPYFNGVKKPMLYSDFDGNLVFNDGSFSNGSFSRMFADKENFSKLGGLLLSNDEQQQLEDLQETIMSVTSITELSSKINTSEFNLLLRSVESDCNSKQLIAFLSVLAFYHEFEKNGAENITYNMRCGDHNMINSISNAFEFETHFQDYNMDRNIKDAVEWLNREKPSKSEVGSTTKAYTSIKKHLIFGEGDMTVNNVSVVTFHELVLKENPSLMNAIMKRKYSNDHLHYAFMDVSDILNNPIVKEHSAIGILFDESLKGQEKLVKLYDKLKFEQMKQLLLNTLEYKIQLPTLDAFNKKFPMIIADIMTQIELNLPVLNTSRHEVVFTQKSNIDYDKLIEKNPSIDTMGVRIPDSFPGTGLLNESLDGFLNKKLNIDRFRSLDNTRTGSLNMAGKSVTLYDNGVEMQLFLKTFEFTEEEKNQKNYPNVIVIDTILQQEDNVDVSEVVFKSYLDDLKKTNTILLVNNPSTKETFHCTLLFERLKDHPSLIVTRMNEFENRLNAIFEIVNHDNFIHLSNNEKTKLVAESVVRMNAEMPTDKYMKRDDNAKDYHDFVHALIAKKSVSNSFKPN